MSLRAEGLQTRVAVGPYIIRTHRQRHIDRGASRPASGEPQGSGWRGSYQTAGVLIPNKLKESNAPRAYKPLRIEDKLNPDKVNPPTAKSHARAPEPKARTPERMTLCNSPPRAYCCSSWIDWGVARACR